MKIDRRDIGRTIEKLEEILLLMEEKNVDEVNTECNTYGLDAFISYGYKGYLNIGFEDIYDVIDELIDKE